MPFDRFLKKVSKLPVKLPRKKSIIYYGSLLNASKGKPVAKHYNCLTTYYNHKNWFEEHFKGDIFKS